MFTKLRVKLIQQLIHINEGIIFYPKLRAFYQHSLKKSDPVIFDVGANKGQSIDFFLDIFPTANIYAFEPNKKLYALLLKKYKGKGNIKLFNLGVSDKDGTLTFNENVIDETSTFEQLNYDSEYLSKKASVLGVSVKDIFTDSYEVPVVTLASFISKHGISTIDVLKVDVEGHERAVFKGLFNGPRQVDVGIVQFENHQDDMYINTNQFAEIDAQLLQNNFTFSSSIKHGFADFYEMLYRYTG